MANKIKILPIELTPGVQRKLYEVQANRQIKEGKRTSLKRIAQELIEQSKI